MNYSFTDYEDAVINALADLRRENGGYLAELNGYAGQLDTPTALKTWAGRFPAITVAVPNASYPEGSRSYDYWGQYVKVLVFIGAQSWRGQAAARGGEIGGAKILADVRSRLLNKELGLGIRGCFPVREQVLASDQTTVIYVAEYQIINDRILEE
jgi:phage gp37-like protein